MSQVPKEFPKASFVEYLPRIRLLSFMVVSMFLVGLTAFQSLVKSVILDS